MSGETPIVGGDVLATPHSPNDEVEIHRFALVHVLTAEFQGIDPNDFEDITEADLESAKPRELVRYLLNTAFDGQSVISYQPKGPEGRWVRMTVTPNEFMLFSRHLSMLAKTAINSVLTSRDEKLQKESGNSAAKARSAEDRKAAQRAAVRAVIGKKVAMEGYLKDKIESRLSMTDRFIEMTRNPNLVRGTQTSVRERFENLRLFVFGDMLDAIGNYKQWSPEQADEAVRILQKCLYLEHDPIKRRKNFSAMLGLARSYYSAKRALVLGRIEQSRQYLVENREAVQDVIAKELEKQRSKRYII